MTTVRATLVTIVSLYGPKTGPLRDLLAAVQGTAAEVLGPAFSPYPQAQVHGTLFVLGGYRATAGEVINEHYLELRGERHAMDFGQAQRLVLDQLAEPLAIRIGGFGPAGPAPFTSQGRPLPERSFSAQAGRSLVLMGWPAAALASAGRCQPLDALRRSMASAGVLHRYHAGPGDVDDDFHLVVGHYAAETEPGRVQRAVVAVREYLAAHPVDVLVGPDQVRLLAADSPTLAAPWFSSKLPVDPGVVARLYR
jgi:hypothetical protein